MSQELNQPQKGWQQSQGQQDSSQIPSVPDFGGSAGDQFMDDSGMDLPSLDEEIPSLEAQDRPQSPPQKGWQSQPSAPPQYPSPQQSSQQWPQYQAGPQPSHGRRVRHQGSSIYVKVDAYKEVLSNLQGVRSELRKADKELSDMTQDISKKDKEYEKWRSTLGEIQKKLIYVDKTLFKGDHR